MTRSKLTPDFPPNPDDPRLLTPRQAAAVFAISPRKLWAMTASGEIPCVRFGRSVRYSVETLRQIIKERMEGGDV